MAVPGVFTGNMINRQQKPFAMQLIHKVQIWLDWALENTINHKNDASITRWLYWGRHVLYHSIVTVTPDNQSHAEPAVKQSNPLDRFPVT